MKDNMITIETLKEKQEKLTQQKISLEANVNAVIGAIQMLEQLIAEVDKDEEVN